MSYKTLSAQEFLQGKYPQMRGEKWNSNENINDNWIAEMMEEYASQQTSTLRKEIEGLTRAYNQCSESHRRSVDSHCIEKELLQKEIEEQHEVIKCQNEIIIGRQKELEDLKEQNEKMLEIVLNKSIDFDTNIPEHLEMWRLLNDILKEFESLKP